MSQLNRYRELEAQLAAQLQQLEEMKNSDSLKKEIEFEDTDAPDSGHQVDDPPLTPDDQVMAILEYCRSAWADLSRADALFAQGPSHHSGAMGTGLVIEQSFDGEAPNERHLHQDFLISLGLQRQGDSWLRPVEGFQEVVRLLRDEVGNPVLLEARSEHLRYYLKAHGMYLLISTGTNAGSGAGS